MKKLTSMTLTATLCAVMGFATIGIAESNSTVQNSENMEEIMDPTPYNGRTVSEDNTHDSLKEAGNKPEQNMEDISQFVIGTVTLVGDDMIKLLDGETGESLVVKVNQKQEESLSSGYIIDAEIRDGKLIAFSKIGVPENVEDIVYSNENLPREGVKIQMPRSWEPQS